MATSPRPSRSKGPDVLYRRLVIKLGTSILTGGTDRLDPEVMAGLVDQVARLVKEGAQVAVVTSGAIAAGRHRMGFPKERRDVPFREVLAAVGQVQLMQEYDRLFGAHGIVVAQALLSRVDLTDRAGYLNVRNTLLALLDRGVVPIVNENDVVATEEIEGATFGDNDNLSAMVANLIDADALILLTDRSGLYTGDPARDPTATLIPRVEAITPEIEALAGDSSSGRGTGGMVTKLQAARLATASGAAVVIAGGREPDILLRLARGEQAGTLFPPATSKLESRRRWMLSGLSVRGSLTVDEGAAKALRGGRSSLLPIGVTDVQGSFERGDIVRILGKSGGQVAVGIADYSAADVRRIMGKHSQAVLEVLGYEYGDEVVHLDNLVLL